MSLILEVFAAWAALMYMLSLGAAVAGTLCLIFDILVYGVSLRRVALLLLATFVAAAIIVAIRFFNSN